MAVVLLLGVAATAGQRPPDPAPSSSPATGDLTRLADGVFVQIVSPDSDAVSNSGVIVLDSGVLVFDSHFTPEAGAALAEKIKAVTPRLVRYVVNSHFHPDHTHGNQSFPSAHQIIGSDNTRRDMLRKDEPRFKQSQALAQTQIDDLTKEISQAADPKRQAALRSQLSQREAFMSRMSALRILAPVMTFEDRLSILDAGREVQLLYLGAGHTEGDIVLYLPQEKIVFLGDLFFHDGLPSVEDADLLGWMKTLREALKLDARTFVPGHGAIGSRQDVEGFLNYLEDLKALVAPAVARGDSLEQLVQDARLPAKYAAWGFQNFFPANLQEMYSELKAADLATQQGVKKSGLCP